MIGRPTIAVRCDARAGSDQCLSGKGVTLPVFLPWAAAMILIQRELPGWTIRTDEKAFCPTCSRAGKAIAASEEVGGA